MRIVEKYYEWSLGASEKSAVIIYNSMWGATHKMAEFIGKGIGAAGIPYKIFEISTADKNDVITEIFKAKGILLGSSTVNNGILASLSELIEDLIGLKFINKVGAAFGSYGWSGESPKILEENLTKAKIKILQEPIKVKYMPDEGELEQCIKFGRDFAEKMVGEFQ
jgi:flavorubredoxin